MNAVVFAAPIPVVYLSPQAISPLSASNTPVALSLPQRVDLADPAGTTSSKLKQDNKSDQSLLQQGSKTTKATVRTPPPSTQQVVLDGKVDVYV